MNLKNIVKQLESCNFECEAGFLKDNKAFVELKNMSNLENFNGYTKKELSIYLADRGYGLYPVDEKEQERIKTALN